jgi:hypothetical protein
MIRRGAYLRGVIREWLDEGYSPEDIRQALYDSVPEQQRASPDERALAQRVLPQSVEIDANAMVTRGDDGMWVQAWVLIPQETDDGVD